MIKDTFFSSSRFMNLCRKDMVENWKTNLIRIVMLYGVMTLLFIANGYFSYRKGTPGTDPLVSFSLNSLLFFLFAFGILLASTTMDKMKTKTSRLSVLMTPVTPFENFFSRWIIYTLVYPIVLLIVFMLADYTRVLVCNLIFSDATIIPASLKYIFVSSGPYQIFKNDMIMRQVFLNYFMFQSFFVLGSTIWPRNSFIKTLLAGMVITFSYSLVAMLTIYLMWGNLIIHVSDGTVLEPTMHTFLQLSTVITVFFTLFNWVMAYYRFKESDIIH